jgi:PIN domain nuclease of toxin-antitoxin system
MFVWWVTQSPRLTASHRQWLDNRNAAAFVSAATGWEIAIKVKLGKWSEAAPLVPDIAGLVLRSGLQLLDVTMAQAERAGSLDLVHRDPFDRLLAAQALSLDIPILTVDPVFAGLGCKVI